MLEEGLPAHPSGPEQGQDADEGQGDEFGDGVDLWRHRQLVRGGLLKETQDQEDHGGGKVQQVEPLVVNQQVGRQLVPVTWVVAKLVIVFALL